MKYKYNYINDEMKEKMSELITGDNGDTIKAWTSECVNAGYINGILFGVVVGGLTFFVSNRIGNIRKNVIDKYTKRSVEKIVKDITIK